MATPLKDYKIGEYALVLDLLGTSATMSQPGKWLESLKDLLVVLDDTVNAATNITDPTTSLRVFQYGDTVVFPGDDPERLIALGMVLQTQCFPKDILLQMALSGGGAYHITDPSGFGSIKPLAKNIHLQTLIGMAVARGHALLRGVRGPRLLIDDEIVHISPVNGVWQRYLGAARHQRRSQVDFAVSEVEWWINFVGDAPETTVENRIRAVRRSIEENERHVRGDGGSIAPMVERENMSLSKRIEHLEAFLAMLRDEPVRKESLAPKAPLPGERNSRGLVAALRRLLHQLDRWLAQR
jgi:hypothetical protein